jgi:hypothetical protein
VQAVIQTYKAISKRRFHSHPGLKLNRLGQRGFYDHVMRDEAELNRIRAYVEENPLRWALDRENLSGPFV